ncbi:MAG: hypothetical protein AB1349_04770 [Elusimicrobiota bacterium]
MFRRKTVLLLLAIVMILDIIIEYNRLKNEKFNQQILKIFRSVYRDEEVNKVSTLIFTLSGLFFTILFFKQEIAILSILFLTFGDGFAALVGEKYGRHKIFKQKSLEGTITNLLTCLIVGFIFSVFFRITPLQIILGSITATVIEILPVKDNFLIPIASASVMLHG